MDFFYSFVNLIPVTLGQGLIYAFIALGIMMPFRLLAFPDLTCEGSFPLGGCLFGALLVSGADPFVATAAAILAGFLAGAATAYIHLAFRINTLLAGILVMTMLYSVNLRIMGKANIALFTHPSIFAAIDARILTSVPAQIALFALLVVTILVTLNWFLRTQVGFALRVVGANPELAPALGVNLWRYTLLGLGLANALNASAGALLVQIQGYADIGMGLGILINGLAALVIGETLVGRDTVLRQLLAPVVGSIVYYQLVSLGLSLGLHPSDLKLATGAFVLMTLALPALKGRSMREFIRA